VSSTRPDLPEHAEKHVGTTQRFLPRATEKKREQNQKNDRSLASESSIEPLGYGDPDLGLCDPTPARDQHQGK
jgi:hypothetical protein